MAEAEKVEEALAADAFDEPPVQVAVAVVIREAMVLIGTRPQDVVLGGFSEFPGGKIQATESPAAAAVRECREETGVEIKVERLLEVVKHQYDHATVELHFFLCRLADGDSTIDTDERSMPQRPFEWVGLIEIEQYRFPPANDSVLLQLRELFRSR